MCWNTLKTVGSKNTAISPEMRAPLANPPIIWVRPGMSLRMAEGKLIRKNVPALTNMDGEAPLMVTSNGFSAPFLTAS